MLRFFTIITATALTVSIASAQELRGTLDAVEPPNAKPSQIVIVSYDGGGDNKLWQRSRQTAKEVGASYTYFLSCTLILDRKTSAGIYKAPGKSAGRSNIGFGQSQEDVKSQIGRAH